jgi:hypothetical protein
MALLFVIPAWLFFLALVIAMCRAAQLGDSADAAVHGQRRSCGSVHSRDASYSQQAGARSLEETRPSLPPERSTHLESALALRR